MVFKVVNGGRVVATFPTKAEARDYIGANGGGSIITVNVV